MSWFKVDDRFPAHRKVRALRTFGARVRADAVTFWLLAGCECAAALGDGGVLEGFISHVDLEALAHPTKPVDARTAAAALVSVGLWHEADGGWLFHDWPEYQPTAEQEKAKKDRWRAEKKSQRDTKRRKRQPVTVSGPDTTPDSGPDTAADSGALSNGCPALPGPGPVPSIFDADETPPHLHDAVALRWRKDFEKARRITAGPPSDRDVRAFVAWLEELPKGADRAAAHDAIASEYWRDPWTARAGAVPSMANLVSRLDRLAAAALAPKPVVVDPHEYNRQHGLVPAKRSA